MAATIPGYKYRTKIIYKKWFWKNKIKLYKDTVFGKTMENIGRYGGIKLLTNKARTKYLVSEQNYHKTKLFSEYLLAIEQLKWINRFFYK